jgi:hypothetical protein
MGSLRYVVGECWDSERAIDDWLDETNAWSDNSAGAFDFPLRWRLRDLCDSYVNRSKSLEWQACGQEPSPFLGERGPRPAAGSPIRTLSDRPSRLDTRTRCGSSSRAPKTARLSDSLVRASQSSRRIALFTDI